jgi:hypothetical protein
MSKEHMILELERLLKTPNYLVSSSRGDSSVVPRYTAEELLFAEALLYLLRNSR